MRHTVELAWDVGTVAFHINIHRLVSEEETYYAHSQSAENSATAVDLFSEPH